MKRRLVTMLWSAGLILTIVISSLWAGIAPAAAATPPGTALGWGSSTFGQIGIGTTPVKTGSPTAVAGTGGTSVVAMAGGEAFSLFLKADGTVWASGRNAAGQLGTGAPDTQAHATPLQVTGLGDVKAVAAGASHALALKNDGTLWAWGYNLSGQLGTTSGDNCNGEACSAHPIQVPGLANVTAIAAGLDSSLAVKGDGSVWAWGNNSNGALGDGTTAPRSTPVQVKGPGGTGFLDHVVAVAINGTTGTGPHTMALKDDGTVYTWGKNRSGELGIGTSDTLSHPTPTQVTGLTGIKAIAAGGNHALALRTEGDLMAWGDNAQGQLGTASADMCGSPATVCNRTPVLINGLGGVIAMAAGTLHSIVARGVEGTVYAWGANGEYELGNTSSGFTGTPTQVQGLTSVTTVAAGARHSLAVQSITYQLYISVGGSGTVTYSPNPGPYVPGTVVTLMPHPADGQIFVGWTVDGQSVGWADPLKLTMNADHNVIATFNTPTTFCDVNPSDPYFNAIRQLSARGVIRGFDPGDGQLCFGPNDNTLRAQMAALIARPLGWDQEDHGNGFSDRGSVDDNLWRNVGTLAFYNVAKGYKPETCASFGVASPCYGPTDHVLYAQVISFITRGMVAKGYWTQQSDNPALYPNIPADSGHRQDIATYVHYVGSLPGTTNTGAAWSAWDQPSTRGWFAEAEWRALDSHFTLATP